MISESLERYIKNGIIQHDLKILPEYMDFVLSDRKHFELRKDDRNVKVGDMFVLREWDGEAYTGRYFISSISYILRGCKEYGLEDGFCIFGW